MSDHVINVRPERRMDGQTYHRAVCSCGEYRSGLHGYHGRAESAGRDHANAKAGDGGPNV